MYTIYADGDLLYSPNLVGEGYAALNPKLEMELNKAGSLSFKMPETNVMYDKLKKLKTTITVLQDGEEIFRGRVVNDERDFYNRKDVYCEGELSFLLDSVQRPYSFQGSIPDLFKRFLNTHNGQVESDRRFTIGEVTVKDSNNYVNRSNSNYSNTFDELSGKLIKTHGGYLRTRLQGGVRYLDYVEEYGKKSSQKIEFGVNLLDITEYIDAGDIFTVLIPVGAEQKDKDGNVTGRLTIADVNGGRDYIEDAIAISLFGRIWKVNNWDDVTIASNLLAKGREYLNTGIKEAVSLSIKAADLHTLGVDVEYIKLGDYVEVVSLPHKLDEDFLCSKVSLYLAEPNKSEYTFGVVSDSFTQAVANNQSSVMGSIDDLSGKVNETSNFLLDAVAYATSMLTGSLGGYKLTEFDEDGKWLRDLYMDSPDKDTAKNLIQFNMNGIGFSSNGYAGPYKSAWTIDGRFVANFITSGEMQANRVRGGILQSNNYKEGAAGVKFDMDNGILDANKFNLSDYLNYDGSKIQEGEQGVPFTIGGWQIKRAYPDGDLALYWDTVETQENGIGAKGPWVVWGGWNQQDAFNPENYKFVVTRDGVCKAMEWLTGSKAELKDNIQEYDRSGLEQVLNTTVYTYVLKNQDHVWRNTGEHIGFVIGDGYPLSPDLLDSQGGNIDMYRAIGVAYKAIQELNDKIEDLERRIKNEQY